MDIHHITWPREKKGKAATRLTVLEKPHVVSAESLHQLLRHVHLAKRQLVVIAVVQDVEQVCVERVDVLRTRKIVTEKPKKGVSEGGGGWGIKAKYTVTAAVTPSCILPDGPANLPQQIHERPTPTQE